ncbi:transposase [Candidatus Contubernalis alkaliaceticus]|uniref:transposase n=1 Tax=Candidatus Contubernalis alkaliaceticus TaxID=338645 RepID=UPI001F4C0536|nr:transposase [Candidatus Contubernalis alkalaceticus]UNC93523.1 transposase [Candidatus Contubernalis alkalaceticus]
MSRKNRVWYPGAVYHIMCRGNHRHEIYRDDEDRQVYLTKLQETMEYFPYLLHGYCLMTNHVHLQLETIDINISEIMKKINMLYVLYFNKKYSFVGHLFQGRYRSEIIEEDPQFLSTSRYIHMNPVMANMVETPIEYPWSSYKVYLSESDCAISKKIVTTQKVLGYFRGHSRKNYQKYVERI